MDNACPLCTAAERSDSLAANEYAVAVFDRYPVSPGHALILSRRHVADLFELSTDEWRCVWSLLPDVKRAIECHHSPAGYNIGVNAGVAAGQTIGHVHVHVIPRYPGDVHDPRGGVRWVLPARANYWSSRE